MPRRPYYGTEELDHYGFSWRCGDVTEDARWVDPSKRVTKEQSPYGYSEFFIFGNRHIIAEDGVHAYYSDRLAQWDFKKCHDLLKEHVPGGYRRTDATELSRFLSAYEDREVRVVALAEGCNISNGYPYFIIWFREGA